MPSAQAWGEEANAQLPSLHIAPIGHVRQPFVDCRYPLAQTHESTVVLPSAVVIMPAGQAIQLEDDVAPSKIPYELIGHGEQPEDP